MKKCCKDILKAYARGLRERITAMRHGSATDEHAHTRMNMLTDVARDLEGMADEGDAAARVDRRYDADMVVKLIDALYEETPKCLNLSIDISRSEFRVLLEDEDGARFRGNSDDYTLEEALLVALADVRKFNKKVHNGIG
jgi:hypothetical protein